MPAPDEAPDFHEACYEGRLEVVRRSLADGADPNAPGTNRRYQWIPQRPTPLTCVAIAWAMTRAHVEIARLLIAFGATVDESVFANHGIEMVGGPEDHALDVVLRLGRARLDRATHALLHARMAVDGAAAIAELGARIPSAIAALRGAGAFDAWCAPVAGSPLKAVVFSAVAPLHRIDAIAEVLRRATGSDDVEREEMPSFERPAG